MRSFLAGSAIAVAVFGLYVWFAVNERPRRPHFIPGMYASPQRHLMDYVDPITSVGLHEVRWDHIPQAGYAANVVMSTTSTSAFLFVPSSCSVMTVGN